MCGEKDIFDDDPLTDSQLMAVVNAPTPVDPIVPARSAETGIYFQPKRGKGWLSQAWVGSITFFFIYNFWEGEGFIRPSLTVREGL